MAAALHTSSLHTPDPSASNATTAQTSRTASRSPMSPPTLGQVQPYLAATEQPDSEPSSSAALKASSSPSLSDTNSHSSSNPSCSPSSPPSVLGLSSPASDTRRPRLQTFKTAAAEPSLQEVPLTASLSLSGSSPHLQPSAASFLQAAAVGNLSSKHQRSRHSLSSSPSPPLQGANAGAALEDCPPLPLVLSQAQRAEFAHPFGQATGSPSPMLQRAATVSAPTRPANTDAASSDVQAARTRAQSTAVTANPGLRRHNTTAASRFATMDAANAVARADGVRKAAVAVPRRKSASGLSIGPSSPPHQGQQRAPRSIDLGGLEAKVVVLGAQGVGKTSIVHRYTSGQFSATAVPSTIGASFLTKKLVVEGVKCRLQIWDTAGQERFRSMAPMYYRGSHAAIIVYDVTSRDTFADIKTWIDELQRNMGDSLVLHIVGAKADLAPAKREVDQEQAREQVLRWLCPEREVAIAAAAAAAASAASSAPMTPSTSRLGSLSSLAMGTASRRLGVAFPAKKPSGSPSGPIKSTNSASGSDEGQAMGSTEASFLPGDDLDVLLSEVSAKNDYGIEDVFVAVTERLVDRRAELEQQRLDRQRHSIFLTDPDGDHQDGPDVLSSAGWSCC
ncbi:unnamed protein product [Parajaminaea phylloscopi]